MVLFCQVHKLLPRPKGKAHQESKKCVAPARTDSALGNICHPPSEIPQELRITHLLYLCTYIHMLYQSVCIKNKYVCITKHDRAFNFLCCMYVLACNLYICTYIPKF